MRKWIGRLRNAIRQGASTATWSGNFVSTSLSASMNCGKAA